MYRPTQIYVDHQRNAASEQIHVPAMGICEIMPSGVIRHGGEGSEYPSLIMVFHNQAWSLSPNGSEWSPAKHRLIVWQYEARHEYGNPSRSWNHSWLRLTGRWIERTLRRTAVPLGVPVDITGDALPLRYMQMISDELRGSPNQDPDMLEALLHLFWHDLERRVRMRRIPRLDPRLERARRFIESHFDRPFNLEDAANQAHLSPSHFCSRFARQFGTPPREYAMRLRLQRSAQLLANQDLAVFEVAQLVGFSDALYFSRLFRERYGLSPRQFRHQQRA
jgi:AraC family transcriptional regulator, arabinose operon regulatory protein